MDVTNENTLAVEQAKVLFNTRVTKIALGKSWLVTGECWDDQEQFVQIRLKFWHFDEKHQTYSLNTNILLPHDKSITAIDLNPRSKNGVNFCATAGGDNLLKLWSDCKEVYGKELVWQCVGSRKYKNLPIQSLCFSRDGSMLLAGFGSAVVIFLGSSLLEVQCVLSPPRGLDGVSRKIFVSLPEKVKQKSPKKSAPKTKEVNVDELVNEFLNAESITAKNEIVKTINPLLKPPQISKLKSEENLTDDQKESIFEMVFNESDLNLQQKLHCLNAFGVAWDVTNADVKSREQLLDHLQDRDRKSQEHRNTLLHPEKVLSVRDKYSKMALAKLLQKNDCVTIPKLLTHNMPAIGLKSHIPTSSIPNVQSILTGVGEFSHLIIVATINRVLIWNLLTLKVQAVLKLTVEHMDIDPVSGLVAVVTQNKQCKIVIYLI